MIPISRLRHRVTLEKPVLTPDEGGGNAESFAPVATLWAAIEPINAITGVQDLSIGQTLTHKLIMRMRTDIKPMDRLVKNSRIFEVVTVFDPDETGRMLNCLCRERTS